MQNSTLTPTTSLEDARAEIFLTFISPYAAVLQEMKLEGCQNFESISQIGHLAWNISFLNRKAQSTLLDREAERISHHRLKNVSAQKPGTEIDEVLKQKHLFMFKNLLTLMVKKKKQFHSQEKWKILSLEFINKKNDFLLNIKTTDDLDRAIDEALKIFN